MVKKKGILIGYVRISTVDQDPALQINALKEAGVDERHIYQECKSGANKKRHELLSMLQFLKKGDTVLVWKLDRLGRSMVDLVNIINVIEKKGVGFRSLTESIDTTTPTGKFTLHLFASLSEFERGIIRERTKAGIEAAKLKGRFAGRPRSLSDDQVALIKIQRKEGRSLGYLSKLFNTSVTSIHRALTQF